MSLKKADTPQRIARRESQKRCRQARVFTNPLPAVDNRIVGVKWKPPTWFASFQRQLEVNFTWFCEKHGMDRSSGSMANLIRMDARAR